MDLRECAKNAVEPCNKATIGFRPERWSLDKQGGKEGLLIYSSNWHPLSNIAKSGSAILCKSECSSEYVAHGLQILMP